jgi:ketosteroid isomerase-like protein
LKRLFAGVTSSLHRSLLLEGAADYRRAMADEVMAKENAMTTPVATVRDFYAAIAAGDTEKMVGLMAPDIEWISVVDFDIQDRGPEEVMKKVFVPLMQEWESFSPAPSEFLVDGSTVVSLGHFACVHRATHKRADLAYAHVWDIQDGKIERHRQYIDTLALEQVRRP